MADEQIVESLTQVNGIGRWTVEMFLIFCLNRPDVLPVDDFGVRKSAQLGYGLKELPGKKDLLELGEKWRPWRTIATWYLWRRPSDKLPSRRPNKPRDGESVGII
jgi:DNA-3-methyladenine glycosylase II